MATYATVLEVDVALAWAQERLILARDLSDLAAVCVIEKQLDRLLDQRNALAARALAAT